MICIDSYLTEVIYIGNCIAIEVICVESNYTEGTHVENWLATEETLVESCEKKKKKKMLE